jgi:hypothetical protein
MQMNQEAFDKLQYLSAEKGEKKLVVVPKQPIYLENQANMSW